MVKYKLKKEIGLFQAVLYGVGIILGAGIYALIGIGAGIAGNALWISFLVGAFIAAFTGFSYAELSSMYPQEAAEFVYVNHAFKKELLAFIIQWIMLFTILISTATVALGFGGYWSFLFGGNSISIAVFLVSAMSILNYLGMKDSARFNDISTIIESFGLLLIVVLGGHYIIKNNVFLSTNFFQSPSGVYGVISATTVLYFAFIGFESLVNMSEEVKNAEENIPKALLISLVISALIYVLVSVSAVGVLGSKALAVSKAPLAETAEKALSGSSIALSLIALFATSNTVLISTIVGSRLIYGLSKNSMFPAVFSRIGKRGTPYMSVLLVAVISCTSLLIGNLENLAHMADFGIFAVYIFVNASLIALRYSKPDAVRRFKAPLNIGNFPVMAFLGILLNLAMMYFFDFKTFVYGAFISMIGIIAYFAFSYFKNKGGQ